MLKNIFSVSNFYIGNKKIKLMKIFGKRIFSDKNILKAIQPKPIEHGLSGVCNKKFEDYVAIVAIAKDEAKNIKEWIEFHKLIGIDRFYFYDNESSDNTKEVLKPYIEDGSVVYHYIEGKSKQNAVYSDAIYRYKNNTTWMAIIDIDEYIVPIEKDNIKNFLKDYEKYPAVVINWILFDSNGYEKHPENKLITEAYTRISKKPPKEYTIKSIIKPKEVEGITSPHFCYYKNNKQAVNENFEKIFDDNWAYKTKTLSVNKIRLNHYYSKSFDDYINKINKGYADRTGKREILPDLVNFPETAFDYVIQKYVPKLRKQMGMN